MQKKSHAIFNFLAYGHSLSGKWPVALTWAGVETARHLVRGVSCAGASSVLRRWVVTLAPSGAGAVATRDGALAEAAPRAPLAVDCAISM